MRAQVGVIVQAAAAVRMDPLFETSAQARVPGASVRS